MDKLERIGCLYLSFLNAPEGLSFASIKKMMPLAYQGEAETARRKFERDKEELKALGLELQYKSHDERWGGGAMVEEHVYQNANVLQKIPEVRLSKQDYCSLAFALLEALGRSSHEGREREVLYSAARKIFYKEPSYLEQVPAAQAKQRPDFMQNIDPRREGFLSLVYESIQKRKSLQIRYVNREGKSKEYLLSGRALLAYEGRWCLLAWCHKAKEERRYYIDQIQMAELGRALYKHDPNFHIRNYSLHPLTLQVHEARYLEIKIKDEYVENFRDFLSGALELLGDYSEDEEANCFSFQSSNIEALFAWLLRYPEAPLSLCPPYMQEGFRKYLSRTISLYA